MNANTVPKNILMVAIGVDLAIPAESLPLVLSFVPVPPNPYSFSPWQPQVDRPVW